MRSLLAPLVGGLLLAGYLPGQTPRDQTAGPFRAPLTGNASLSGLVTVVEGGQSSPLRRGRVKIEFDKSSISATTDTDTDGRYRIEHLPYGVCRLTIDKAGFVPLARIMPIVIPADQAVVKDVQMIHAAALEGRVTTRDGEPVSGLTVSAVRLGFGPYGRSPVAVRQAITDDRGHFRVHTLPAGEYALEAAPDPQRLASAAPGSASTPKPAPTFFPGTPRLNEAGVISVTAGQDTVNLDFTISTAVMTTVTGNVRLASGQTPATFGLRLQRMGAPPGEVQCFQIPNNPFQCPNVPAGDYWVLAVARATPASAPEFAAMTLTVPLPAGAILVSTAPAPAVSGRVEVDGGAPLPRDLHLQVAALEAEYELPTGGAAAPALEPGGVGDDGTFTFPSLFGPRLIRVRRLPDGWAIKNVSWGHADVTDVPTSFASADQSRMLRVVLTRSTGSLQGAVADASERPAPWSRVVVFAEDSRLWRARSRGIKTVEAGADGRYVIAGLLPGRYFAVAIDALDDGTWEDPDVLARLQHSAGAPIVVGTDTLTVNLKRTGGL